MIKNAIAPNRSGRPFEEQRYAFRYKRRANAVTKEVSWGRYFHKSYTITTLIMLILSQLSAVLLNSDI
jgi:hypothetical protein